MNGIVTFRDDLSRLLAEAAAKTAGSLINVTVECSDFEPAAVFGASSAAERLLWHQPECDFALVGIGVAERFEANGASRFEALSQRRRCAVGAVPHQRGEGLALPIAFSALSFSASRDEDRLPLPDGLLLIPRLLFIRQAEGPALLSVTLPRDSNAQQAEAAVTEARLLLDCPMPTRTKAARELNLHEDIGLETWSRGVHETLAAVERGDVEKVVLARTVRAYSEDGFDLATALRALVQRYDHCTVLAYALDGFCFLGATPERLLRLENGIAQVDCLAGSIAIGEDDCDSASLATRLLADAKERHEHAVVVKAIEGALQPLCTSIEAPEEPGIKGTADVQHLHTPLSARLRPGAEIFEIVERLHPTPAMGGHPREAALPLLERIEDFDRGWYAGPCGWVDASGDGEFVVGIRSGLIQGNEATLFAGAGIVEGSDPKREFEETNLKLQAMLWALRQR